MKRLHYQKLNSLSVLHDELLEAIPELRSVPSPERPGEQLPVMWVEGRGDDVWLTVPDDVDEERIAAVVEAHDPTAWEPSPDPDEELARAIESAGTLQELKDALLGRNRTYSSAVKGRLLVGRPRRKRPLKEA